MTDKELSGKEKLKEALRKYELSLQEKYKPEEIEIGYSKRYKRNIERLFSGKTKNHPKFFNTVGKRIAACVAAAVIAFSGTMSISAIREPVIEFFTNMYEKFVEIFFDGENVSGAPTEIETVYTLGYVPDGYELEKKERVGASVKTIFTNGEDNIVLSQYPLTNDLTFDNENSNFQIIAMSDFEVAVIEKNKIRLFYWSNEKYAFNLTVPKELGNDECIEIIESLTVKD